MDKSLAVIIDHPQFHKEMGSIQNQSQPRDHGMHYSFGLDTPLLVYLAKNARRGSRTLEVGISSSTLILALAGCRHACVTPFADEIDLVRRYAADNEIDITRVNFINDTAEKVLPGIDEETFDVILLNTRTSFPWPVIDWFYAIQKLNKDGLIIIQDARMSAASLLVNYMKSDSDWEVVGDFSGKAILFRKKSKLQKQAPVSIRHYSNTKQALYQPA